MDYQETLTYLYNSAPLFQQLGTNISAIHTAVSVPFI